MRVEEGKEMRCKGRKGHVPKALACPATELDSVLRLSETVKEFQVDVGKFVSNDPICM